MRARRIGGAGNDGVTRVAAGNRIVGQTRSGDAGSNLAGFSCPGASQATPVAYLARVNGPALTDVRCLAGTTGPLTNALDLDAADGGYWLTVTSPPSDGDFANPDVTFDGGAGNTDTALLELDPTLQTKLRSVRMSRVRVVALAVRPDGCLVALGPGLSGRVPVFTLQP